MKTVTCKNPKSFKLTKEGVYEVESESKGYFHIRNDKGISARYSSDLFEEIGKAVAEAPKETIAPPQPRTEQDCIASIDIDNNALTVNFIDMNMQIKTVPLNILLQAETNISCGISQINGINDLINIIDNATEYEQDDLIALKRRLFRAALLRKIQGGSTCALVLFSTNTNTADNDCYYAELDELAIMTSETLNNPNSGNPIKIWGLTGRN